MLSDQSTPTIHPPGKQFNGAIGFHDHRERDDVKAAASIVEVDVIQATARLVGICWASQLHDAGEPVPDLQTLMVSVLREVGP
jgi:hypothetical protein